MRCDFSNVSCRLSPRSTIDKLESAREISLKLQHHKYYHWPALEGYPIQCKWLGNKLPFPPLDQEVRCHQQSEPLPCEHSASAKETKRTERMKMNKYTCRIFKYVYWKGWEHNNSNLQQNFYNMWKTNQRQGHTICIKEPTASSSKQQNINHS